ncbi:hypothetical protein [Glycomyces sp. NRRL B-16210]|uniref:hypothetical protein n=1 Tax=Glycomyces sp. NRRL B-16210 TaxID=1463821 RepID=UPI0004BF5D9A|nr:hypothetical protein [Glycomyces sp. NRRL B-16210]
MSDAGLAIDTAPVRDTRVRHKALPAEFDEVHRDASDADPEPWFWGAPGLASGMRFELIVLALPAVARAMTAFRSTFEGSTPPSTRMAEAPR